MSRVGKAEIKLPAGVKIKLDGRLVQVEGPKGKLSHKLHPRIKMEQQDDVITFVRPTEQPKDKALHGTTRAVVNNLVVGVSNGFTKSLIIKGVGYRGEQKGKSINLLLGYSHPILFTPPDGIDVKMNGNDKIDVSGIDKQAVGQVAAEIRGFRSPEPYKGKGIRYSDEQVIQKEVKKA